MLICFNGHPKGVSLAFFSSLSLSLSLSRSRSLQTFPLLQLSKSYPGVRLPRKRNCYGSYKQTCIHFFAPSACPGPKAIHKSLESIGRGRLYKSERGKEREREKESLLRHRLQLLSSFRNKLANAFRTGEIFSLTHTSCDSILATTRKTKREEDGDDGTQRGRDSST